MRKSTEILFPSFLANAPPQQQPGEDPPDQSSGSATQPTNNQHHSEGNTLRMRVQSTNSVRIHQLGKPDEENSDSSRSERDDILSTRL
jgi:hypothetical protein